MNKVLTIRRGCSPCVIQCRDIECNIPCSSRPDSQDNVPHFYIAYRIRIFILFIIVIHFQTNRFWAAFFMQVTLTWVSDTSSVMFPGKSPPSYSTKTAIPTVRFTRDLCRPLHCRRHHHDSLNSPPSLTTSTAR